MALSRRTGQRFQASIWPGFVDAMSALLLVLMFVLTIFMVVQFALREQITGQESQLDALTSEVNSLARALGLEQQRAFDLESQVSTLSLNLDDAKTRAKQQTALIANLTAQNTSKVDELKQQRAQITSFEAQVATLLSQRDAALGKGDALTARIDDLKKAQSQLISDQEALQLALAKARDEIDANTETARLAAARRDALTALIAELRATVQNRSNSLADALAQLQSAKAEATSRADRLAKLQAELATKDTTLATQKEASAKMAERLLALQAALDVGNQKLTTEQDQAKTLRERLVALQAVLADEKTARAAQQTITTSLEGQLSEAEAAKLASQAAAVAIQKRLAELEASLTDTEAAQLAQKAAAEALRQKLAQANATLSEKEARRLEEQATLLALKKQLADVQDTLSKKEAARLTEIAAAQALRDRLSTAQSQLTKEEAARLADAAAAQALRKRLENSDTELTAMTLALEEQRKKAEETLTLLAAAEAVKKDLDIKLAAALLTSQKNADALQSAQQALKVAVAKNGALSGVSQDRQKVAADLAAALAAKLSAEQTLTRTMTQSERQGALLAAANKALKSEGAKSAESQRRVALLNQQVSALRNQLGVLQALIDESGARDAASKVQIEALGSELNVALARAAAEQKRRAELEAAERKRLEKEAKSLTAEAKTLERYRSEFFGKVRDILGTRKGVKIVGDRFVFASEVLFHPGEVALSTEGKAEIAKIASILKDVINQIPPEIKWVLRVDGHTDNVPLTGTGKYADNWELSQGRALSVVRYMIDDLGLPPDRLSANGFGEYQPVNPADTPEARAQNRRIEIKFTEK